MPDDQPVPPPAPLLAVLRDRIEAHGPLGVDAYMAACLTDPAHGYYTRPRAQDDPFGARGDFTTAPEISQMFGELIGLWAAAHWQAIGTPDPVALAELGPGRGTLMADALRAAATLPGFLDAIDLHLVDPSPGLRARQAEALAGHAPRFHDTPGTLPQDRPLVVIANEVFDAVPVRQWVAVDGAWHERRVDWARGGLVFSMAPAPAVDAPPVPAAGQPDGTILEAGPAREAMAAGLARRLARQGGAALIIDYGHDRTAPGDTVQAVARHRPMDPLAAPGLTDLTAHVDFDALGRAARAAGARTFGPIGQGRFLDALGLHLRAEVLIARNPARAAEVAAARDRLIEPSQMGTLFRVLALAPPGAPVPPGFPVEGA